MTVINNQPIQGFDSKASRAHEPGSSSNPGVSETRVRSASLMTPWIDVVENATDAVKTASSPDARKEALKALNLAINGASVALGETLPEDSKALLRSLMRGAEATTEATEVDVKAEAKYLALVRMRMDFNYRLAIDRVRGGW